jgi:hypothetical protein
MVGFKASTEGNLVRGKEQNIFCCARKVQEFQMGCVKLMVLNMAPFVALQMSNLFDKKNNICFVVLEKYKNFKWAV